MKTIYNVAVLMEDQAQCDRMKQLCIDNGLPIWKNTHAFNFNKGASNLDEGQEFEFKNSFAFHGQDFFVCLSVSQEDYKEDITSDYMLITESEFIELLKEHKS